MSVAVSAIASGFEGCLGCYGERDKAVDTREKKQEQTRNKLGDLGVFGGGHEDDRRNDRASETRSKGNRKRRENRWDDGHSKITERRCNDANKLGILRKIVGIHLFYCDRGNTVLPVLSCGRRCRRRRRLQRGMSADSTIQPLPTYLGNIGPRGIVR